jgi:hypothetical protein
MLAIQTKDPQGLLAKIKAAAADESENGLVYWTIDEDGDFAFLPDDENAESEDVAFLRAVDTSEQILSFEVIWREDVEPERSVYAFYEAQFIAMLLESFPEDFEFVAARPLV